MHGESTYYSSASSVSGARTEHHTLTFIVSGRPSVTFVRPWDSRRRGVLFGENPFIVRGFHDMFMLEGYQFGLYNFTVYISAGKDVYTNTLSAVTAFDLFKSIRSLSARYPTFSGFKVPEEDYHIISQNTMTLLISATQNTGKLDIILANPGGYGTLFNDYSGRIVNVT